MLCFVNRYLKQVFEMTQHTPKLPKPDGRRENALATQAALCAAGRALFGALGYDGSSVGALCAQAGVTAGALYHHYGDKKGLFAAVAEQLDADLARLAGAASAAVLARGGAPWDAFLAGVDAFLAAGTDPGARRIGLADAAAVLGADAWLAIRERHGLGALMRTVVDLQAARVCAPGDARRLARIMLGMLYGAVEALPDAGDDAAAAAAMFDTRRVTHAMLATLRVRELL
ncbi:AcrR family transcriptional regulator [Oxalobacteraceae bacterium GrIS 1.11]